MYRYLYQKYKNYLKYFFVFIFEILSPFLIFKHFINTKYFPILKNVNINSIIILISLWVFVSYLRERYSKFNIKKTTNSFLIKTKDFLIINIIVTLFLLSLKIIGIELHLNTKNLPFLSLILIFLSILQEIFITNIFSYMSPQKHKNVFILGAEADLFEIKDILKHYNYDRNIRFKIINYKYNDKILPDQLILTKESQLGCNEFKLLKYFLLNGVQITSKYKWFENELNCLPIDLLDKENFLDSELFLYTKGLQFKLKRLFDIVLSFFLLILTLPVVLTAGLLVWISDRGPIFYKQEREGLFRKKFNIYKLRSMIVNAELSGPQWAAKNDKRITFIGNILRKTRIDELPQLISVLKGDMSLIGPRPERPEFNKLLNKNIPYYNLRHFLKPGLSGWAQVNYSYSSSINESKLKLSYDLFYISNYSIFIDLLIFFKTMRIICNGRGN